eukprot:2935612-Prymnesium_polylepis.1
MERTAAGAAAAVRTQQTGAAECTVRLVRGGTPRAGDEIDSNVLMITDWASCEGWTHDPEAEPQPCRRGHSARSCGDSGSTCPAYPVSSDF